MGIINTNNIKNIDNINLYYEDYGQGQPIVFIHGWPLNHRMWDNQLSFFVEAGYRVIAYDRRGFGQSSKPFTGYDYDTLTRDLHHLITQLNLSNIILCGFSMGGGEVVRYVSNYGSSNVQKIVLLGAVTPFLLQTKDNANAVDTSVFESMKKGIKKDRAEFFKNFIPNFLSYDSLKDRVSLAQIELNWLHVMQASLKATLDCVDAFGYTDFRKDIDSIDIPTLVIHGDDDRIVPFEVSGQKTHDSLKNSELKIIRKGAHGLTFTHVEEINNIMLKFIS